MSEKSVLNQIKVLLNLDTKTEEKKVEVKFEQAMIEGDVTIEAEAFEQGAEVFVVTEDERVPLPEGSYNMEDGRVLVVNEVGVIASIGEAQNDEANVQDDVEVEVEASEETEKPKKVVESVSKEIHFSDEQKNIIKDIVKEVVLELSKQEEAPKEVVEKVQEELSEAKPIKHNPENNTNKKPLKVLSSNKVMTLADRILQKQLNRRK